MSDLSMLINGLKVSAEGGTTFERRNPLDGSVATRAPAASPADAVLAVEAAAEAFKSWSQTGPGARRALLLKAADALEAKTPQFIDAVSAETGATGMWAGFNVMLAAGMIREAASLTTQVAGEVIPSDVPGSLAMGMRQPAGVVLGIAPWNAPVILGVRAIATPLACGNTVILKGSENCPRTHQLIVEAFQDAGFPPGVVNYVTNAPADAGAVVEAMVAHPAVRRVNFTGSTQGRQDHRHDLRQIPQAGGAGARRQGAAGDPGRRRHRRCRQRRGLRLLCQQRADLHVHRAHHRGPEDRRRVREEVRRQGRRAAPGRPAQARAGGAGLGHRHEHGGALQRADRRRAGQGRQAAVRRQGRQHAHARHRAGPCDARRCASTARKPSAR